MTYGTHMLGGALGGIIMLNMSSPDPDAAFAILGGSVIGALLPDLDHTQSKISRSNVGTSIIAELVSSLTKHRGILHTPIFLAVLAILTVSICSAAPAQFSGELRRIIVGMMIGYLSHLILDTLNPGGIMWLYPLSKKHYHIAQIKTGKLGEVLVAGGMALILALFSLRFFELTTLYDTTLREIQKLFMKG